MTKHTESGANNGDLSTARQLTQAVRSVIAGLTEQNLFEAFPLGNQQDYLKQLLKSGIPLFEPEQVTVSKDLSQQAFSMLLRALTDHMPEAAQDLTTLQRTFDEGALSPHDLLMITLEHRWSELRQCALTLSVDVELLQFFTLYLARPFRQQAAERLANLIDYHNWRQGYCPVCGHSAVLGRQGAPEGQQWLWCCCCNTQWRFARLQCAFCLNQVQQDLGYLTVEAFPGRRIYVCDKCKRYLKVIESGNDQFEAPFDYDLEYFCAVELDRIAVSEGYVAQPIWVLPYESPIPTAVLTGKLSSRPVVLDR